MNTRIALKLLICAVTLTLFGCGEDAVVEPEPVETDNEELETAMQDAIIMDNVINQTNQELEVMSLTVGGSCPEVSFNQEEGNGFEMTVVTFSFGSGCTANGVVRTGTAWIRDSMFILSTGTPYLVQVRRGISYENYSEDEVTMAGLHYEIYEGEVFDLAGFGPTSWVRDSMFLQEKTHALVFGYNDGTTSTSFSQETFDLDPTCWPSSPSPFFTASRTKTGQTRSGKEYQTTTLDKLIQQESCQYPEGGQIALSVDGQTATFQYGQCACNEDQSLCGCNNKGQLTLPNGETKVVEIKKWW